MTMRKLSLGLALVVIILGAGIAWLTRLVPHADELISNASTLEGTLQMIEGDDPATDTSATAYYLDMDGDKRYRLVFNPKELMVVPGSRVQIRGTITENVVAVTSMTAIDKNAQAGKSRTIGDKKVAVILSEFNDGVKESNPQHIIDHARKAVFTDAKSTANYYKENSYGNLTLSGDVLGVYTLPYDGTKCDYSGDWTKAAQNAAKAAGANLSNYDHIVYAFEYKSGCKIQAYGSYFDKSSWYIGYDEPNFTATLVAHEIGHNLGLDHANSLICLDKSGKKVSISTNCKEEEYGDQFDVMSYWGTYHMNASEKERLGWMDKSDITTVTSNGSYTIKPIEIAGTVTQALKVKRADIPLDLSNPIQNNDDGYYYVEFRRPIGFDAPYGDKTPITNGVSIRLAREENYGNPGKTWLIDTNPGYNETLKTDNFTYDAPLLVGQSFIDTVKGVKITLVKIDANSATVDIDLKYKPTPTPSPTVKPNKATVGQFDGVDTKGVLTGWAVDPDEPTKSITVKYYMDGPVGKGTELGSGPADQTIDNAAQITGYQGNHHFKFQLSRNLLDGKIHSFYAYGIDSSGNDAGNTALTNSGKKVTLASVPTPTPSVKPTTSPTTKATATPTPKTTSTTVATIKPTAKPTPTPTPKIVTSNNKTCKKYLFFITICH
jgi:hypothetical protein